MNTNSIVGEIEAEIERLTKAKALLTQTELDGDTTKTRLVYSGNGRRKVLRKSKRAVKNPMSEATKAKLSAKAKLAWKRRKGEARKKTTVRRRTKWNPVKSKKKETPSSPEPHVEKSEEV